MKRYLLLLVLLSLVLAASSAFANVNYCLNSGFEENPGPGAPAQYVTDYGSAAAYPWTKWGGTGGAVANPLVDANNPSPRVWSNFGNPDYVNVAAQNNMDKVWLYPGAVYHYHAQYYVPASEVVAGTYPVVGIGLTMHDYSAIPAVLSSASPAAVVSAYDTWVTFDGDWTCPATLTGTAQLGYMAFSLRGRDSVTQKLSTNPGGYMDNLEFGLKTFGMNNRSVLTDAAALGKGVKTWGTCADAAPATGAVTSFTITDGYSTPVRVKVAAGEYLGTVSDVNGHLAIIEGQILSDENGRYVQLGTSNLDKPLPTYTITASAGANGSITPSGAVTVTMGNSQTFTIAPADGYTVADVTVDGKSVGAQTTYTFDNVTDNHTISATFAAPTSFTITATAGANGSITPSGAVSVTQGADQAFTFAGNAGYVPDQVTIDGGAPVAAGTSYTFTNVQANHTISVTFKTNPNYDPDLYFSAFGNDFTGGTTWPLAYSSDSSIAAMTAMGTPSLRVINGQNWIANKHDGDGFHYTNIPQPGTLPFNGGTIVVACRPIRYSPGNAYQCVVSVLLRQFSILVQRDSGMLHIYRQGNDYNGPVIPNGQITIISLVVQPTGDFKVYLNGDPTPVMNITETSTFSNITASEWYGTDVNVGKGWNGDGWSSFNGDIGDVYVYKTAIADTKREALEDAMIAKYGTATNYTITASAGTGGTIAPTGAVTVPQNADQPFVITPDKYFDVTSVLVDGATEAVAGPDAQTYKFTNVTGNHTIAASFTEWAMTNITGKVALADGTGVSGVKVTAAGGREPYTATTATDGTYSIRVKPGVTYTLTAFKTGYTMAPASLTAGPGDLTGKDFTATFVGTQKLIELKVDPAWTLGASLTSWTNTGTLGGQFVSDGGLQTNAASVNTYVGEKAVVFNDSKLMLSTDATTAAGSLIKAPSSITGNGAYTVLARLCSDHDLPWEQYYFTFAHDGDNANCAAFCYGISGGWGAVAHWGEADMGWNNPYADSGPSINVWHTVAVTFDGTTEKAYIDGVMTNSEAKTLAIWPNNPFAVGSRFWWSDDGSGREAPFNGGMTLLQVYDGALTADQINTAVAEAQGTVTVSGTVTDANQNSAPVAGAKVVVQVGGVTVPTTATLTDANGNYTVKACVPAGSSFTVHASKANYMDGDSTPPTAFDGTTTTFTGINVEVASITTVKISGTVTDYATGLPVVGAKLMVTVPNVGQYPFVSGANGAYTVDVPIYELEYIIDVDPAQDPLPVMATSLTDRTINAPNGLDHDVTGENLQIGWPSADKTGVWTGSVSSNWGTPGNWTNNHPALPSETAKFSDSSSSGASVDLAADYAVGALDFTGAVDTTIGSAAGKTLSLTGTSVLVEGGSQTISANMSASQGIVLKGAGTLTLAGNVNLGTVPEPTKGGWALTMGDSNSTLKITGTTTLADGQGVYALPGGNLEITGTLNSSGHLQDLGDNTDVGSNSTVTTTIKGNGVWNYTAGTYDDWHVIVLSNFVSDGGSSITSTLNIQDNGQLNSVGLVIGAPWGSGVRNATVNQTGGSVTLGDQWLGFWGSATTHSVYNFDGGLISTPGVWVDAQDSVFNFNGGTLQSSADCLVASDNASGFLGGLTHAYVKDGGVIIDTNGFSIDVVQSFEALGNGGLTKLGAGILNLSGTNTYTGATVVQAGTLGFASAGSLPAGALEIASGAQVALNYTGNVTVSSLKLGGVVKGSGTYSASTDPTYFTGTGTVTVP